MKKLLSGALLIMPLLYGCTSVPANTPTETAIPVTINQSDSFEDQVVRMNNDTFYISIVLDLSEGPVTVGTEAAVDLFYSFQLQDDRNANYAKIVQPEGEYTFYHGEKPENIVGAST